jgi:hypothetical protein
MERHMIGARCSSNLARLVMVVLALTCGATTLRGQAPADPTGTIEGTISTLTVP